MARAGAELLELLRGRRSQRSFSSKPVPEELLEEALSAASFAASSQNEQPWNVTVVRGAALERMRTAMSKAAAEQHENGIAPHLKLGYQGHPDPLPERSRANMFSYGQACYGAMGIAREDKAARRAFIERNWRFFGAPVELFVHLPRGAAVEGTFLHTGCFVQNLLLALHAVGLGACAQVSVARFAQGLAEEIGLDSDNVYLCGIAVGYPNDDPVNSVRTERMPTNEWVTWVD